MEEALENLFRGDFSAHMTGVELDPIQGPQPLRGRWEIRGGGVERQIILSAHDREFIYRSHDFGREQWLEDASTGRIRRIGNRQWRKFAFNGVLTYEDLVKMPFGYLKEASRCTEYRDADSLIQISVKLDPVYQSYYSRLELAFSKSPILPRSLVVFDVRGKRQKSIEFEDYLQANGKWLLSAVKAYRDDPPAGLSFRLNEFSFPSENVVKLEKDHSPESAFQWLLSQRREEMLGAPLPDADADAMVAD